MSKEQKHYWLMTKAKNHTSFWWDNYKLHSAKPKLKQFALLYNKLHNNAVGHSTNIEIHTTCDVQKPVSTASSSQRECITMTDWTGNDNAVHN